MGRIEVDMGSVETGQYDEELWTQGLATCYGVVAYGLPANNDTHNVNKVMAHVSAKEIDNTMTDFLSKVRSSGMRLYGVCLSLPDPAYNDGPTKAGELRAMVADINRVPVDQVSRQDVSHYQVSMKARILSQSEQIRRYCRFLCVSIVISTRNVANEYSPPPYCQMRATASPDGVVSAEVHRMVDIPNVPDPVADPEVTKRQRQGGGGGNKYNTTSTRGLSGGGSGGNNNSSMSTGGFSGGRGGGHTNTSTGGPPGGSVYRTSAGGSARETTSRSTHKATNHP
ncbi:hypothetical protein VMCG_10363 [Cytospora schulzeri]|uniref:Uncharacterized protein n=1 Tax=Cytospora schulzeri TaxID=448051 RepID=A0A423VC57_9PEZI|nr:hypothetical protein VMCG_10363 [Valsa malicola]